MKVFKFFTQLLLYFLLPVMIFTVIASRVPIVGNIQSFIVLTGSMEPTLPVGSLIYTQKAKTYKIGDVIAFKNSSDVTVTHRIVDIVNKNGSISYKTKGDANNTDDSALVPYDKVLGRNFLMILYIGYFIDFLRTPLGFVSLIIFPTTVFVVFEIWNFKTELEKHIEKKVLDRLRSEV